MRLSCFFNKRLMAIMVMCLISTMSPSIKAIGHMLDERSVLPLIISKEGPTRLSLHEDTISDLFFYPEDAAKVVLHPSGHLFIVPASDHTHLYLTVMSKEGRVQDLKLSFKNKEAEPIELRIPLPPTHPPKKGDGMNELFG